MHWSSCRIRTRWRLIERSLAFLASVLGTTPETATLAVMYLRVRCFACPAFLLYNVGTGNFRGRKDTRTPLLAYMANNITYVLLVSRLWSCLPAEARARVQPVAKSLLFHRLHGASH